MLGRQLVPLFYGGRAQLIGHSHIYIYMPVGPGRFSNALPLVPVQCCPRPSGPCWSQGSAAMGHPYLGALRRRAAWLTSPGQRWAMILHAAVACWPHLWLALCLSRLHPFHVLIGLGWAVDRQGCWPLCQQHAGSVCVVALALAAPASCAGGSFSARAHHLCALLTAACQSSWLRSFRSEAILRARLTYRG